MPRHRLPISPPPLRPALSTAVPASSSFALTRAQLLLALAHHHATRGSLRQLEALLLALRLATMPQQLVHRLCRHRPHGRRSLAPAPRPRAARRAPCHVVRRAVRRAAKADDRGLVGFLSRRR